MKLATKLTVGFLSIVLVILGVDAFILYRSNVVNYVDDMKTDMDGVGLAMKLVVEDAWGNLGERRALEVIDDANLESSRINIRFVWLDLPPENVRGPKIPGDKISFTGHGYSSTFTGDKEDFIYAYFPVSVDNSRAAAIELSESLSFLKRHTEVAVTRIAVLSAILLIVAITNTVDFA